MNNEMDTLIAEIESLEQQRDTLIYRLDDGASKIEAARSKGQDVTDWEDFWITLFREFEKVTERLRAAAKERDALLLSTGDEVSK